MAEFRDPTPIDPNKDYQITELADFIRTKMDGHDVREALALGLERAYEDAATSGNANMEVAQARGSYPTLARRLLESDETDRQNTERIDSNYNEVTAQLAEKVEYNENESIGMEMLKPDIKQALTDGEWNVNINTSEIENGAITLDKFNNEVGIFEKESHNFEIGWISAATGNEGVNSRAIRNVGLIHVHKGESIVLKGQNTPDKQFRFWHYDENGNPTELGAGIASINQLEEDRFFKFSTDSYIRYTIWFPDTNVPSLDDDRAEELSSYVYLNRNTIRSHSKSIEELKRGNPSDLQSYDEIVIDLPLEYHGIEKDTGNIMNAHELVGDENFESFMRTGKYLKTLGSSKINLRFTHGQAFIYEYDVNFNYLGYTELSSDVEYQLNRNTKLVKFSFENLVISPVSAELTFTVLNAKHEWVFNDNRHNRPTTSVRVNNFIYETPVNQGRSILEPTENDKQYGTTKYFNSGLLKLPPNYDPYGDPVKLIIFNHGASGYATFRMGYINLQYEDYYDYLLDEGYAVMGVFRKTSKYYDVTTQAQAMPTTMSAHVNGYNHVIKNYNIAKDGVFVAGKSMGGKDSLLMAHEPALPVLAVGLHATTHDIIPIGLPYGYNTDGRLMAAEDFGFEGDHSVLESREGTAVPPKTQELKDYMLLNAEKTIGYDPWLKGLIGADAKQAVIESFDGTRFDYESHKNDVRIYNAPVKAWYANDDYVHTLPQQMRLLAKTIQNGGGIAELRVLPDGTGDHNATDVGEGALKVPEITTRLGITHTNVPLAYVELVHFFRRFEN